MGRHCTVCEHPQRVEIERARLSGSSMLSLAKPNGLSAWAIRRHFLHVTQRSRAEVQRTAPAGSLQARVEQIIEDAQAITKSARGKKQFTVALQGVIAQLRCVEVLAKLNGEMGAGAGETIPPVVGAPVNTQVNVNVGTQPSGETLDQKRQRFLREFRAAYSLSLPEEIRRRSVIVTTAAPSKADVALTEDVDGPLQ
jgi:hypothetical protein